MDFLFSRETIRRTDPDTRSALPQQHSTVQSELAILVLSNDLTGHISLLDGASASRRGVEMFPAPAPAENQIGSYC